MHSGRRIKGCANSPPQRKGCKSQGAEKWSVGIHWLSVLVLWDCCGGHSSGSSALRFARSVSNVPFRPFRFAGSVSP
eukprot:3602063-Karenia_brevis.AAC.1